MQPQSTYDKKGNVTRNFSCMLLLELQAIGLRPPLAAMLLEEYDGPLASGMPHTSHLNPATLHHDVLPLARPMDVSRHIIERSMPAAFADTLDLVVHSAYSCLSPAALFCKSCEKHLLP